jgi:aryl carrier-like protein
MFSFSWIEEWKKMGVYLNLADFYAINPLDAYYEDFH